MKLRSVGLVPAALLTAALLMACPAWSAAPGGRRVAAPARMQKAGRVQDFDVDRRVDINTLNLWVWNFGSFGFADPNPGLIWPKGTTKTAIFASGLWLAAQVAGETRIAVAEYTQDFVPGPMAGGTFTPDRPEYKVYKMVRFKGDAQDTAHVELTADQQAADANLDPIVHHSWSEYVNGAAPNGAPVRWYHLNPDAPDDSTLGPDVLGDQMLWSVFNDADPGAHGGDFTPATLPLGVEVRHTTFAFDRQGALGNTVFLRYKLYNRGADQLDSMFVSVWCDPDLGGFTDDLVGCDTTLSLGFVYNSNNRDQLYGSRPPAAGYDFFLGPVAQGDTLPMTSFNKYINGTDPASHTEVYNYMNGLTGDGNPVVDPSGVTTKFVVAGDPVTGQGWLDDNPADRRFMMTAGPFRMAPGDSQEVVAALIVAQGRDRLSSISGLKFFDIFAQDAFDKHFLLPSPPPQPRVSAAVDHGQVRLCWDSGSRDNYPRPDDHAADYQFEGYNVYQGESVAGPWKLIATYDEVDQIRVIFDRVFDPVSGQTLPEYPVAFGSDNGVQYCHTVTEDAISGGQLKDGSQYFFAVTSYSYNPSGLPKVLENAQQVIRVIPQRAAAGTDLATAKTACATYQQIAAGPPKATDHVTVQVVNPDSVSGHQFKIAFRDLPSPVVVSPGDTAVVGWNLLDAATGDTLLKNQANLADDDDYRVIRGLKVKLIGFHKPVAGLAEGAFLCQPNPPLEGYNGLQGPVFGGGGILAADGFAGLDPSADPDSFVTVEIRFSHRQTQKAYRYLRRQLKDGSRPPGGRGYLYGGFREVPFTVWDTDHNRQLDAAFIELMNVGDDGGILPPSKQPATFDSTWAPNTSDNGNRELLFAVSSPYDPNERPEYAADGAITGDLPSLYMLWARKPSVDARIADGDAFRFLWNAVPAGPNDEYLFGTTPLARSNLALARGGLDRIRVVPNPYYTRSRYELNQFNRVVRFMNMPEVCTVRIFNLAGELVRTLSKTDPSTSILSWDLLTENRLPVASGVYIYHIEVPGAGSTVGRMVVFMEKERLNSL